jgi:hypothetical protein
MTRNSKTSDWLNFFCWLIKNPRNQKYLNFNLVLNLLLTFFWKEKSEKGFNHLSQQVDLKDSIDKKLSNGYSRANLASASTRQKISIFGEYSHSPKWPFSEICETRQARQHLPSNFGILAKLAFAKNKISWYSPDSTAFGEFVECFDFGYYFIIFNILKVDICGRWWGKPKESLGKSR